MDTSFRDNVEKNNLAAHAQVLRQEVESVSKQLSSAVERSSLLAGTNESLSIEIAKQKDEVEGLRSTRDAILKDQQEKVAEATTAVTAAKAEVLSIRGLIDQYNSAHEAQKTADTARAKEAEEEINKFVEFLAKQEAARQVNEVQLEAQALTIAENNGKIQEQQQVLSNLKEDHDRFVESHNKTVLQCNEELKSALDSIEAGREKIDSPLKFLRAEEERLDNKRKDVDIYAARIQDEYARVFPGRVAKL